VKEHGNVTRVGITGHRGLPDEVAARVKQALYEVVASYPAAELVGVSCIADGPDTWFADAVLSHGGSLEVVVPAEGYRDSLPQWHHAAYDDLLARSTRQHATGLRDSDSHAHMTGSEILVDLADEMIAVWDGQPARGHGGTADVVRYAQKHSVPVRVVWPQGAARD
jgi:hypothetical protein